jgi:hypothetical protein
LALDKLIDNLYVCLYKFNDQTKADLQKRFTGEEGKTAVEVVSKEDNVFKNEKDKFDARSNKDELIKLWWQHFDKVSDSLMTLLT